MSNALRSSPTPAITRRLPGLRPARTASGRPCSCRRHPPLRTASNPRCCQHYMRCGVQANDVARAGVGFPGGVMMAAMVLSTAFTRLFGLTHPIALAPMGGSAGGALAAAVSNGGGLGLLGGGTGDEDWLARELPVVVAGTRKPWGVGFQSWSAGVGAVERALEHGPAAVMLSFGD